METTKNAVYTATTTGTGERKPLGLWRKAVSVLLALVLAVGVWAAVPVGVNAATAVEKKADKAFRVAWKNEEDFRWGPFQKYPGISDDTDLKPLTLGKKIDYSTLRTLRYFKANASDKYVLSVKKPRYFQPCMYVFNEDGKVLGHYRFTKKVTKHTIKLVKGKTYYFYTCMDLIEDLKISRAWVTVNKTSATLGVGKAITLKASVSPSIKNKKVTWSSSNKKIAAVDKNGKVTAKKAGEVKITAQLAGGQKAVCTVTVKKITAKPSTKAVPASKAVKKNESITLTAPKGTALYYTTNGKNPTTKSTKVKAGKTAEIKITKKTTVKVIAQKSGEIASAVVVRNYTV
ncbi:MAG: Ig-like domain-containing protein [Oscillospiraceae bacterium]|nr:Ig-like domain-containing protein [Oscillospiraceae bacterium]